jgi:hypothetical protein
MIRMVVATLGSLVATSVHSVGGSQPDSLPYSSTRGKAIFV